MNMLRQTALLLCLLAGLTASQVQGQDVEDVETQRLGQTGMKFLVLSVDPRAAALGDAVTAVEGASNALFANPAGMAFQSGFASAGLGRTEFIGDIKYNVGSVAIQPGSGGLGVFGVSVEMVDYGEVLSTIRSDGAPSGYIDVGTLTPSAMAAGFGYARMLSDRFAVGGQVKYVSQDMGSALLEEGGESASLNKSTAAFDFGVLYRTGFRSLNFAASVRNFARELTYAEDSFELPLTLTIGISMDAVDLTGLDPNVHSFLLAIDAERPRDYSEQIKAGVEYTFMRTLSLRAGYVQPSDERGINLGAGLRFGVAGLQAQFDYAYSDFGIFDAVHRVGLSFGYR